MNFDTAHRPQRLRARPSTSASSAPAPPASPSPAASPTPAPRWRSWRRAASRSPTRARTSTAGEIVGHRLLRPRRRRGCASSAAPRTTGAAGAGRSTPHDFDAQAVRRRSAAGRSAASTSTPTAPRPTASSTCRRRREATDLPVRAGRLRLPALPVPLEPADALRREVRRRDRGLRRASTSASTPTSSTSASTTRLGSVTGALFRYLRRRRSRLRRSRARAYASAPAASRTPGCCSTSAARSPEGIGNRHDLVGRCFCDHPHFHDRRCPAPRRAAAGARVLLPERTVHLRALRAQLRPPLRARSLAAHHARLRRRASA